MQTVGLKGSRLSSQQARLWSLQTQTRGYRAICAVSIQGPLVWGTFHAALRHLVARHEILRTLFHRLPAMDVPVQVVVDDPTCDCLFINLEHRNTALQDICIEAQIAALQQQDQDLSHGPLLQAQLFSLSADRSLFLFSLPTLCADVATLRLFVTELQHIYARLLQNGSDFTPEEEPLQYADVSAWQEELLLEEEASSQQAYWQKIDLTHLAATPIPLQSAQRRPSTEKFPQIFPLAHEQFDLIAQAQAYDVSVEAWLLTCWQLLLARLNHSPDVLIGVAGDGRIYEELTDALGLYSRFIPIQTQIELDRPFVQTLAHTHAMLQEAMQRQAYFTWETANQDNATSPFFPLSFEYYTWPLPSDTQLPRFSLSRYQCHLEPCILKLSAMHNGDDLQLALHYDPQHLASSQVARLAAMFHTVLHQSLAHPQGRAGTFQIVPPTEQAHLLKTYRATSVAFPSLGLAQLFEVHAARSPQQLAVLSTTAQMTYETLNSRANQLASTLRKYGVGPNVRVGLYLPRSVEMIVALLAILKAGGAYVPLDPESPSGRLEYQLHDLQAPLLLTQHSLIQRLPVWEGRPLALETLLAESTQEPSNNLLSLNTPDDLAYIIYTSGSTGVPKGVMIHHRNVINYTQAICHQLNPQPGWHFATVSTLAADLGNTAIFCALASGGTLQVLDYETITSGEALRRWVSQYPIDVLKIVPSHLSALLTAASTDQVLPRQALVLGGEKLPRPLLKRLQELHAPCQIYNHYGPTETTVGVLVNPLGTADALSIQADGDDPVPLGSPIANTQVYVLDAAHNLVPVGVPGELYIGGTGLASGYLHQPEQTAERFLPDPFQSEAGGRIYKTGDIVRSTSAGQIEFIGRADNQVKLRGYRVELGEIDVALRQHPQIWDVLTMLRTDETGTDRLIAYVIAHNQLTEPHLREFVQTSLPEQMLPSAYVFLDSFPLTTNGKIDRTKLPLPEQHQPELQAPSNAAMSPIEEILLHIWQDLLGLTSISLSDNFFHLGGHSLLATQLMARIQATLQVEISLRTLFAASTITQLAAQIERALRDEQRVTIPPLVPVSRTEHLPLSFAQQRLWFLDQLEPGSTSYLNPRALRLTGKLDQRALEQSLGALIERHETLRTTFQEQQRQARQIIHPAQTFQLPVIDLQGLSPEAREQTARLLARQEAQQPCNLAQGPLLRIYVLNLQEDERAVLLTMHHIVTDGWSIDIFMRELTTLYQAAMQGKEAHLPALPIQYADFALWQRQWLQGDVLENQLAYWRRQLSNAPNFTLPSDYPRPLTLSYRGAVHPFSLSPEASSDLIKLSQQEGTTLFMTLLAAFQVVLYHSTNQTDIVIGADVANRTQLEVEGLLGFFVNQVVLRTDLSGDPTFREILQRVRNVVLGAYTHQDLPFDKLVETLKPQRHAQYAPFFQIKMNFQKKFLEQEIFPGLQSAPLETVPPDARHDITLSLVETPEGLQGDIVYNTDLFHEQTITRLAERLKVVFADVVAHPEARLHEIESITSEERATQKQTEQALAQKRFNAFKTVKPKSRQIQPSMEKTLGE